MDVPRGIGRTLILLALSPSGSAVTATAHVEFATTAVEFETDAYKATVAVEPDAVAGTLRFARKTGDGGTETRWLHPELRHVDDVRAAHGKLLVVGRTNQFHDLLSIYDLPSLDLLDVIICRNLALSPSARFAMFERFYPRFGMPERFTRHLTLLYDVSAPPRRNRVEGIPVPDYGTPEVYEGRYPMYPDASVNAGHPVYPELASDEPRPFYYLVPSERVRKNHGHVPHYAWSDDERRVAFVVHRETDASWETKLVAVGIGDDGRPASREETGLVHDFSRRFVELGFVGGSIRLTRKTDFGKSIRSVELENRMSEVSSSLRASKETMSAGRPADESLAGATASRARAADGGASSIDYRDSSHEARCAEPGADACSCYPLSGDGSASATSDEPGGDATGPPRVTIRGTSIPNDQIAITLAGAGCGDLEVGVTGDRRAHTVTFARAASGEHTIGFWNSLFSEGRYDKIEATWKVDVESTPDDEYDYVFSTLGRYLYGRYNKPNQAHPTCAIGSPADVFVTEENPMGVTRCFADENEYTATMFSETFRREVLRNGAGRTTAFGTIQIDPFCSRTNPRPAGAMPGYVFRAVNAIRPACPGGTLSGETVAVDPGNPDLRCGDRIFISGLGTKTVTDHCPGCDGATKIDYYAPDERCSGVSFFGTLRTHRLGR